MSKKLKIILFFSIATILIVIMSIGLKDDIQGIEKAILSLNQPMTNLAHIEVLENKKAIAFYEWGTVPGEYFGIAKLKKNLFGWYFNGGSTSQTPKGYKLGWSFSNLKGEFSDYTDIIYGKILDSDIESVLVTTNIGKQYSAKIIEYNNGERLWFLITDGVELLGATVMGLSKNGEIIEKIPS
jgi:hypothetical protein